MTCTNARSAGDRLRLARKLDARIRAHLRRSVTEEALAARVLARMDRHQLHRALGFKNLNAYARSVADWDATKASRMVALVRQLAGLPRMRAAFFRGELAWTKACVTAPLAARKPELDDVWTERTRSLSRDELLALARAETGEPEKHKLHVTLTAAQLAWVQDAVVALQREAERPLELGEVVAEVCRRVVQGVAGSAAASRPIVALGICTECEKVNHNGVTLGMEEGDAAVCDADLVDIRKTPAPRSRTIPTNVASKVFARDQGCCRVPGCGNRTWVQLHHEGGWREVGHDAERIVTLCSGHHRDRHAGSIRIIFAERRATFVLVDGTVLGEVDLRCLPPARFRELAPAQRDPRVEQAELAFRETVVKETLRWAAAARGEAG